MFRAVLDDVGLFRDSMATIAELLDETEFHVTENGIALVASDRAVVAVLDFLLAKSVFREYVFDKAERIGINVPQLLQVLRRAGAADELRLELESRTLRLTFANMKDGKTPYVRSFVIPLIDISRDETPPLDQLRFPAKVSIDAELLASGIDDAELITDSAVFTVRKDKFIMRAESDASSTQLDLESGTAGLKIHDMGEPVRARYSIDYLKKMIKAKKLAPQATLEMGTDYPMRLQFDVPGKIRMSFILAPRIED